MSEHRPSSRASRAWVPGLIVVAVGVAFLMRNAGMLSSFDLPDRWWALFILLGALPSLERALRRYRQTQRIDTQVMDALLVSLAVITVAMIFLFDLAWHVWWPVFVIYAGIGMLLRGGLPRGRGRD
jgi:Na+/glutamate symporter